MKLSPYLPSTQFLLIVASLVISAGLVYTADAYSKARSTPAAVISSGVESAAADRSNWEATLYAIQAQEGSSSLPTPPSAATVDALRASVASSNITNTVGKTLLINLQNAKAQGLGDDIPTQNQLVASAVQQIKETPGKQYTKNNLTIVLDSADTQRAYGNALANALNAYAQKRSVDITLYAIGQAEDNQDSSALAPLDSVEADYRTLVQTLLALPVPQTFVPFHLELVNDFSQIADTYPDMKTLVSDPLRGLAGLQVYQSLGDEVARLLTNIAEALNKDDILWSKDEPGALWNSFVSQ